MSEPVEDFRRRTARIRRGRTTRRLVQALFDCGDRGDPARVSIDEVRGAAGLARGSFYRYFATVDALLDHVGGAVAAQLSAEMSEAFDHVADPALRLALNARYLVRRGASDPVCAALLLRRLALEGTVSEFAGEHAFADFDEAVSSQRFAVPSTQIAADLGHGMLTAMLRRAVQDSYDAARVRAQVGVLLRAFGLDEAEAARLTAVRLPPTPRTGLRERVLELCSEAVPAAAPAADPRPPALVRPVDRARPPG